MTVERWVTLLFGLLTLLLGPWLGEKIRQYRKAKRGESDVEIRKIDHTENLFDRYERRLTALEQEREADKNRIRELAALLNTMETEIEALRERLDAIGAADLALHAVRVLEHIRRGQGIA